MLKKGLENNYEDSDRCKHSKPAIDIFKTGRGKYVVSYVAELMELEGGQKLVRFYDPSGNLIEVRTPINYN